MNGKRYVNASASPLSEHSRLEAPQDEPKCDLLAAEQQLRVSKIHPNPFIMLM